MFPLPPLERVDIEDAGCVKVDGGIDKDLKLRIEYEVFGQEYGAFVDSFAVAVSGEGSSKQTENSKQLQEVVPITEVNSQCKLMFKMPGISCSGSSC